MSSSGTTTDSSGTAATLAQLHRVNYAPEPAPVASPNVKTPAPGAAKRPTGPATRQEWRTPPLWGFRDSGPYLHDGRAATLEEAVALHGGEAARSARDFFALRPLERQQIAAFLKTLVAPGEQAGR